MAAFFGIAGLAIAAHALFISRKSLRILGKRSDIWITVILVHNGFGVYVAWVCIATLLSFNTVLHFILEVSMETSTYVSLGIITFEISVWFALDGFVFWKYTRFLFTPYMVAIFALAGVITENWDKDRDTSIFMVVILSATAFFFVVKIGITMFRSDRPHHHQPREKVYEAVHPVKAVNCAPPVQLVQPYAQPCQAVRAVRAPPCHTAARPYIVQSQPNIYI